MTMLQTLAPPPTRNWRNMPIPSRTSPISIWPDGISLENAAEGHGAVEPPDLFAHPIRPQEIAHPSPCPNDAQHYTAAGKLGVEIVQHARAGEIKIW